jgi:hypothetical protein
MLYKCGALVEPYWYAADSDGLGHFLCNLTPPRSDALCGRAKQDPPGAASCPTAPMGTGPVRC